MNNSCIAIIPARSGSKGLPDKNIKLLNDKPLIAYSIEAALESGRFDTVFVSTDSKKYAEIAKQYGADVSFLRSNENSSDTANSWDVVREVLDKFAQQGKTFDRVMLLQPTSPLRTSLDIEQSFLMFEEKSAAAVLAVTEVDHSPLWCNTLPEDGSMKDFFKREYIGLPRQSLPTYYRVNGAIYLLAKEELNKEVMFAEDTFAYVMPQERSIDIDTEVDFLMAEYLLNKRSV